MPTWLFRLNHFLSEESSPRRQAPHQNSDALSEALPLTLPQGAIVWQGECACHRSLPNTAGDLPRLSQKLIIRESSWFSTK